MRLSCSPRRYDPGTHGLDVNERSFVMAKEYTITLHEPPTTQVIREGMAHHMNEVAQEGWKLVTIVKESGYYYLYWERD